MIINLYHDFYSETPTNMMVLVVNTTTKQFQLSYKVLAAISPYMSLNHIDKIPIVTCTYVSYAHPTKLSMFYEFHLKYLIAI